MAKKRRLSKRDRKIRQQILVRSEWAAILKDDDFGEMLFASISSIDPTFEGAAVVDGKILRYYLFDGEEIVGEYEVAILTERGPFVYSKPFSHEDVPF